MSKFILTYLGGDQPSSQEEAKKNFTEYKKWLESLGKSIISPMNPFKNTHTIAPDGTVINKSTTKMSGFTIIETETIEKAIEYTKSCPFLNINGHIEVSKLVEM